MESLTVAQDEQLRKDFPANVEGSDEFNEANADTLKEDLVVLNEAEEEKEILVEPEKSEEATVEQIKKFTEDPTVRANALINAQDIQKKLKGWFRIQDLIRKRVFDKVDPAIDVLNILCLLGMCYRREHKGELRFHIQLNNADRLNVLNDELKVAKQRVNDLEGQIKQISNN